MKIFISYSTKNKEIAGELKEHFEKYDDIECFIAHDDIKPGSKWEEKIIENLKSSNLFMPLQTEHLSKSLWCQQEAGIAFGRDIKIIPLIPDIEGTDPVGFYSRYQGVKIKVKDLRTSVKLLLIEEGIIEDNNSEEIERRILVFDASSVYDEAGENARSLIELDSQFTKSDIFQIIEITLNNDQIIGSSKARRYLKNIFKKYASKEQLEEFLEDR